MPENTPEANNSSSSPAAASSIETSGENFLQGKLTRRGLGVLALGAATTAAVLGSVASSSTTQAQSLFEPPSPNPKPGEKKPGGAGTKPENALGVGRIDLLHSDDRGLETSIKRRSEVAEHFLAVRFGEPHPSIEVKVIKGPPGSGTKVSENIEKVAKKGAARDFAMTVSLDPDNPKPASQIILETDEQSSQFIINSRNSKDLVQNFGLAYQKYAKVNLNKIISGTASGGEMTGISDAIHLFDLSNYSGGNGGEDLYTKRKDLAETLLVNTFAVWMSQSDQLSQMLGDIAVDSPQFGSAMANVFLFGLRTLEGCADTSQAFNLLGIKKATLNNIVKVSGNEEFENHFKNKGV